MNLLKNIFKQLYYITKGLFIILAMISFGLIGIFLSLISLFYFPIIFIIGFLGLLLWVAYKLGKEI